ncbi:hypothetical protein LguiB_000882 [Lonicera macranthoides]
MEISLKLVSLINESKSFVLLVTLPPTNFSDGNFTTLKSPPRHHLSSYNPNNPANSSHNLSYP